MASLTARQLISEAYNLSGIVPTELRTLSGSQLTGGLSLLNDLFALEGVNGVLISYYKEHAFNTVAHQEDYFISGLAVIESLTFTDGDVRYPSTKMSRSQYSSTGRTENIFSLPITWHSERTLNGTDISLYFKPDKVYEVKIWGKFALDEVTSPDEDLSLTYERYFLVYMRYALARFICQDYNINMPPATLMTLKTLEEKLIYVSPKDYTMKKISQIGDDRGFFNYAAINLKSGWWPSDY